MSFPLVTMHPISAPQLSTVDLIDELEARIATIRSRNGHAAGSIPAAPSADELRAEMERAEISPTELAKAMDLPHCDLHAWIAGREAPPVWALAAARLVALLPPSARRKLLTQSRAPARRSANRTHPFSRIEEL